jgi:hypothetical protein
VDPRKAVLGIFDGDPAHDAVNLIAFFEEQFRQIASILSGDTSNERTLLISQS